MKLLLSNEADITAFLFFIFAGRQIGGPFAFKQPSFLSEKYLYHLQRNIKQRLT